MEAADEKVVNGDRKERPDRFAQEENVSRAFGAFRAEWLDERLFQLFREPRYLGSLMADQPMVLEGGRGTGKTTVLKGLSFRGVFARFGGDLAALAESPFIGLYYKVTMSQVAPFDGAELSEERWIRLFSHYLNLIHCTLVCDFFDWHEEQTGEPLELDATGLEDVAISLGIEGIEDTAALRRAIHRLHGKFESFVNNVAGEKPPHLSMLGAPQRALLRAARRTEWLREKRFYFLIDEYENLKPYQQRVFNTLIKESGEGLVYKIGVREEGWPERATLNVRQRLEEPQDFRRINIAYELRGSSFPEFAAAVCAQRIADLRLGDAVAGIEDLLPGMSEEEEAERLGVGPLAEEARAALREAAPDAATAEAVTGLPDLKAYLVLQWAEAHGEEIATTARDFFERPNAWDERYGNYKHTLLYTIRAGKSGIRKHYAGWSTFCLLAASNIRFLLQLVETALRMHVREDGGLGEPVEPEVQTKAAQEVAEKNLFELESVSGTGDQLLRLLLGLGRTFNQLAAGGTKHRPETNQFELTRTASADAALTGEEERRIELVLKDAVMNLALIRTVGNKPQRATYTAEDLYIMHPVFSPFFVFSYRRKRKMSLQPRELLDLIDDPSAAIRVLIGNGTAAEVEPEDLPDQMRLFAEYFRAA